MPDLPLTELHERLGIEILRAEATEVVGTMPVVGNRQPAGLLHGGATAALVEGLASLAAWLEAGPDRSPVGVDMNVTHLRPARAGRVTGTAKPIRVGHSTAVYAVEVVDESGRLTAIGRLTCNLVAAGGISPSSCGR